MDDPTVLPKSSTVEINLAIEFINVAEAAPPFISYNSTSFNFINPPLVTF